MSRLPQDEPIIDFRFRSRKHDGQHLRVVEIVYTPSANAEDRLRRAFDILLGPVLSTDHQVEHDEKVSSQAPSVNIDSDDGGKKDE